MGVRAARNVEQEEKKAFIDEQVHFCEEKQKMFVFDTSFFFVLIKLAFFSEEIDTALARQMQKELKISSSSKDRPITNTHYRPHEKKVNESVHVTLITVNYLFSIRITVNKR